MGWGEGERRIKDEERGNGNHLGRDSINSERNRGREGKKNNGTKITLLDFETGNT